MVYGVSESAPLRGHRFKLEALPNLIFVYEKQIPKILIGAILPDVGPPHLNSLT